MYDMERRAEIFAALVKEYKIEKVFTNHDYDPYATQRDSDIKEFLHQNDITFETFKDQVLLDKNEVLKDDGKPYTIFTPYSRKWKAILTEFHLKSYDTRKYFKNFYKQDVKPVISLAKMNFTGTGEPFPPNEWNGAIIRHYKDQRDIPGINGTSRLGVHLRFGTISIRDAGR